MHAAEASKLVGMIYMDMGEWDHASTHFRAAMTAFNEHLPEEHQLCVDLKECMKALVSQRQAAK